jgi:hypothetical protein
LGDLNGRPPLDTAYTRKNLKQSAREHHDLIFSNGDLEFNQLTILKLRETQACLAESPRLCGRYRPFGLNIFCPGYSFILSQTNKRAASVNSTARTRVSSNLFFIGKMRPASSKRRTD